MLNFFRTIRNLFHSERRRRVIASVGVGFYGQLILIVSGVLSARILGVEGRGYFALLVLFPAIITQLGTLGLPRSITYYLSREQSYFRSIIRSLRRIYPIQTIVLLIIHFGVLELYLVGKPDDVVVAAYISLIIIPGNLAWQYGLSILQVDKNLLRFNILSVIYPTMYVGLIVFVYASNFWNLQAVVVSWSVSIFVIGIIALYVATKFGLRNESHASLSLNKLIGFGSRGMLGAMSPLEAFRLDQLVAGIFMSPYNLGLYVVGQSFTNIPRFFSRNIGLAAYPDIARQNLKKEELRLMRKYFVSVATFSLIATLVLIALVPFLIPLFFGDEFHDSIVLAQILTAGAFFMSCRHILAELVRGMGYPSISSISEVSMYPWLLSAGYFAISANSIIGLSATVSVGFFISFCVAVVMSMQVIKRH